MATVNNFDNLSAKISQLFYSQSKNDRDLIGRTLDDLNAINYRYPLLTTATKAVLLINQCCTLIPPEDVGLVSKCCHLISCLITRQNVVVEGRTLEIALRWCLEALDCHPDSPDILLALDSLLRNDINHIVNINISEHETLVNLARAKEHLEITYLALQCLEGYTNPPSASTDSGLKTSEPFQGRWQICFDIFLNHLLTESSGAPDNLIKIKILTLCLRCLQNVILQKPDLLHQNLGLILGVVRSYMLYGLEGVTFIKPEKLAPSSLNLPEPSPNLSREQKGGKITKQRKQKLIDKPARSDERDWLKGYNTTSYLDAMTLNTPITKLKTSDSDFSDSEGGSVAKITITAGRVRQAALNLFLQAIKGTDKSVIFAYWSSFIPQSGAGIGGHYLTTCILRDTSARGRMAALNVLLLMTIQAKLYLGQAEKGDNLAFTPFSVTIGLMIGQLHKCLIDILKQEYSMPVLTQVFKCWAALIQATPYHRLGPGLLSKVVENVKPFIYHKDHNVQVTAVIVLGCVLASEPTVPETIRSFTDTPPSATTLPWLLDRIAQNLRADSSPTAIKLESLHVIAAMSRNYFELLLAPNLNALTDLLVLGLNDRYMAVRLHAGRAVDFVGVSINQHPYIDGAHFWLTLLERPLTALLQDSTEPVLRAVGCDCLSSIGPRAFEQLPRDRQIFCATLLFACSRDEDNSVKGAAVRALGIAVSYPSLKEDPGFVADVAEAVYGALSDRNVLVRIKAAWSLGNLSDTLVSNRLEPDSIEELPDSLLLKLFQVGIKASNDHDKVRVSAVRALGNLLQLLTEDLIKNEEYKINIEAAIQALVQNSVTGSNMKARWNSCYSLGSALKTSILYSDSLKLQETVIPTLMDLVVNFRNFKVRINAAAALSAPPQRNCYAHYYQPICSALLKALETAQNMEDFGEYRHKDHLIEQICLSLGHLMVLLEAKDLGAIQELVKLNCENLKGQMGKVWDRLVPEQVTILYEARNHINCLYKDEVNYKETLRLLKDSLSPDF